MNEKEFLDKIAPLILHQCWCAYQMGAGQPYNVKPSVEQLKSLKDAIVTFKRSPNVTSEQMHENWMRFKLADGWIYGLAKDESQKMHPNLVPYKDLSNVEKNKDGMHLEAQKFVAALYKMLKSEVEEVK